MANAIQTVLKLGAPISAFAFNADASMVAVCPSSNEVHIYALGKDSRAPSLPLTCAHVLCGHDLLVTSIDWAPGTNKIVTCSQDRNAYVWTLDRERNAWMPALVLLRINRAATCVRWAPSELKFAVASGARCVSVCHFEQENDWWISKHLRKPLRSTVLTLAWHPNSVLLATGGTDGCARVFSAFIKAVDERPPPSSWGEKLPFGTLCAETQAGSAAWVHAVEFASGSGAPAADSITFLTHDSSIHEYNAQKRNLVSTPLPLLPAISMAVANSSESGGGSTTLVAGGHDGMPIVLRQSGGGAWTYAGLASGTLGAEAKSENSSALAKFRALDSNSAKSSEGSESSVHQGCIRSVRRVSTTTIATCGVDGRLVLWDTLGPAFKSLKL